MERSILGKAYIYSDSAGRQGESFWGGKIAAAKGSLGANNLLGYLLGSLVASGSQAQISLFFQVILVPATKNHYSRALAAQGIYIDFTGFASNVHPKSNISGFWL